MAKAASGLPGFRDFYPEEYAARAFILQTWRDVARRFGFVEYDGPPLEPLELYTRKSGDEIVGQLYAFTDKGDREVALRPEMTPTFARMVGARANALRKPIRWFSIPQLFRYERQQKGRLREHFQLNVDIVGEAAVTADAELLAVAIECMRAFGLGPQDVRARVSDRRLLSSALESIGVRDALVVDVFRVVDRWDKLPQAARDAELRDLGVGHDSILGIEELLGHRDLDSIAKYGKGAEFEQRVGEMRRYFDFLASLGVAEWVDLDLRIVRGLAYYTGIVFELFDAQGEFRAICGGGRYDTLLASLGGADAPALGYGMGDVVLGELLKARGKLPTTAIVLDYWVAYETPPQLTEAMRIGTALRRKGSSVEYALREQALGKQLDAARKAGAKAAIILRTDGTLRRKDFSTGVEEPFTFPDG